MNLSMRWLKEFVDLPEMPLRQFTEAITLSGSKVESWRTEGVEISKVIVGRVLSLERHPDSDHLWITQIDTGSGEPLQIVTGAQNLKVGDYVPVALHGSTLPGGKKIKKGKLRGVASNGMLCSLGELGLTVHDFPSAIEDGIFVLTEQDGCDLTLGKDIREAIGFDDTTVEFEITSNRPDCFSMIGLAREAAATFDLPLKRHTPQIKGGAGDCTGLLDVKIEAPDLCPIYSNRIVKNVRVKPSPRWMRERLRAMGVRPINNIVDITNYVMLEYGQPMHAFDLRSVEGAKIRIRRAKAGETITTLDGVEHALTENQLVIADAARPIAIAGVMGGENSGILDSTTTIVFESACFNGVSVRTTARDQGMRTEASARFEKGLDPNNCLPAIDRACELVELLDAGDVMDGVILDDHSTKEKHRIRFEPEWTRNFLGEPTISDDEMKAILTKLECTFDGDDILVPTFRPDLVHKADIAEEIARFYGYNKIESTPLPGGAEGRLTPHQRFQRLVSTLMESLGADEIMTYSFFAPKTYDKILLPADSPLRRSVIIRNPLGEDTSMMRTTALPSMLDVLSRNYNNRNESACLYELASAYLPKGENELPDETCTLLCGMYGNGCDFFTAKGMIETLFARLHIPDWEANACSDLPYYHPGRCAVLSCGPDLLGTVAQVHPQVAENFGLEETSVYCIELDMAALEAHAQLDLHYTPLPKFPAVSRDLALICREDLPVAVLEKAIRKGAGKLLDKVEVFDVYQGEQIASGMKSVALRIVLQSADSTLTEEQINNAIQHAIQALEAAGATLRQA